MSRGAVKERGERKDKMGKDEKKVAKDEQATRRILHTQLLNKLPVAYLNETINKMMENEE